MYSSYWAIAILKSSRDVTIISVSRDREFFLIRDNLYSLTMVSRALLPMSFLLFHKKWNEFVAKQFSLLVPCSQETKSTEVFLIWSYLCHFQPKLLKVLVKKFGLPMYLYHIFRTVFKIAFSLVWPYNQSAVGTIPSRFLKSLFQPKGPKRYFLKILRNSVFQLRSTRQALKTLESSVVQLREFYMTYPNLSKG